MAQVSVRVNGREYDLTCGNGEEPHLRKLAQYVDTKITGLRGTGANLSDAQLLLMAGIVISDELSEATGTVGNSAAATDAQEQALAAQLTTATDRLEAMTSQLKGL